MKTSDYQEPYILFWINSNSKYLGLQCDCDPKLWKKEAPSCPNSKYKSLMKKETRLKTIFHYSQPHLGVSVSSHLHSEAERIALGSISHVS